MRIYILIISLVLCCTIAQAAKKDSTFFKHQTGYGLSIYLKTSQNGTIINGTLNYNMRYHFKMLSHNSSLSANINTGVGIPGLSYGFVVLSSFFQFHLPITINYNIGNGASKNSSQTTGAYVGAGPCLDFIAAPYSLRENALSIGPVVNVGFRFGASNGDDNDAKYDLRFSYMSTLNKNGKGLSDILGINFFYSF